MSRVKRVPTMLMIAGLVLALMALAAAAPANAQLKNRKFTVDFMGSHINSPFDLTFFGVDCVEFISDSVVCALGVIGDCGPYTITEVDGRNDSRVHFEADLNFKIGTLILGPVTISGVVDKDGPGGALSFAMSGKIRSPDMSIGPTYTNGSGHGINGCFVGPDRLKPEERWVKNDS